MVEPVYLHLTYLLMMEPIFLSKHLEDAKDHSKVGTHW